MNSIIFRTILVFALLFSSLNISAQDDEVTVKGVTYVNVSGRRVDFFPDSVRMEFPDQHAIVVLEMKNITRDISLIDPFADSLKVWLSIIEKSLADTGAPQQVEIRLNGNGETDFKIHQTQDKVTQLTARRSEITELLPPGWEIHVNAKAYKAYVYGQRFEDMVQVAKIGWRANTMKVSEELQNHTLRRHALRSRGILKDGQLVYSEMKQRTPSDFLILNATAGLGFLGDKFYPELNAEVGIRFADRFNRINHQVTFSYNNLFLMDPRPEGGYTTNANSFLSVSWNKNLQFKSSEVSWLGFGAGYLVTKNGNYFNGNTMKFFISKDVGPVRVIPELYLTDDLKRPMCGIKFNFTF